MKIGHTGNLLHLSEDALTGPTHDELALMGRDGAESAAAKTATMDGDRVTYHLICGDALVAIFGMRQSSVGQIERAVNLSGGHWRERWLHNNTAVTNDLQQPAGTQRIALLLDMTEILGIETTVSKAGFVRV